MTMIIGIVTEVAIFFFSEFDDLRATGMLILESLVTAESNGMRPICNDNYRGNSYPLATGACNWRGIRDSAAIGYRNRIRLDCVVLLVMPTVYILMSRLGACLRQSL